MSWARLLLPVYAWILALTGLLIGALVPDSSLEVWLALGAMALLFIWILQIERNNLLSFASLFSVLFFLYTAAPTAQLLIYPLSLNDNPLLQKLLESRSIPLGQISLLGVSALFAFGIGLRAGYFFLNGWVRGNTIQQSSFSSALARWSYGLGVVLLLSGEILYLLDLARIGGLQALLIPRVERLYALAEAGGNLPFAPILFSGLALAFSGWLFREGKGNRGISLLVLVSLWIVFLLLQGDRRYILYTVLILVGILVSLKGLKLNVSSRLIFYGIGIYVLAAFFGSTRWLLNPVLQGSYSLREAWSWIVENISLSWFLPFNNEFAGPYVTLVLSLEDPQWGALAESPLMGLSYFMALPNLLPRSLYPGEKWETLSFRFSDYVHERYLQDLPAPIGFGFSPLAESVLNFGGGFWAPLTFFFLLGFLIAGLSLWARKQPFPGAIVYALLLPQAFNLNRIDFAWSFQEAVYYGVAGWTFWWLGNLLLKRGNDEKKKENP